MGYVLINEDILPKNEVSVDIEDRAYQFGDGAYEVIAVYEGVPFKTEDHLNRLKYSLDSLSIKIPYELSTLKEKLYELKEKNDLKNGLIYFQVSRGLAKRKHDFPSDDVMSTLIANTTELATPSDDVYNKDVKTIVVEDIRWSRCDIKSLNLLLNVLVKEEALKNGCYESIMQKDNKITEASKANVFVMKNGNVYTQPANNLILNAVTRLTLIDICKILNVSVFEEPFTTKFLKDADEIFLTSSFVDVIPVSMVDNQEIPIGEVTSKIQNELSKIIEIKISKAKNDL